MLALYWKHGWLHSVRAALTIGAVVIAVLSAFLLDQPAKAAPVTLGAAANYGVIVGSGQTLSLGGGDFISGDVGVGSGSTVVTGGFNIIEGSAYEDSGVTNLDYGWTFVTGGAMTASMSGAINNALTAANTAAALAATPGLVDQRGTIALSGQSLTIKAVTNLSENVLYISSFSLLNSTLTFDDNGYTNAKFIIDVTGGFSVTSSGAGASAVQGINGATASDIIFNIEGTGTAVSLTGNSGNSVIGTVLAPSRNVTMGGGGSLTGAIIAGVSNAGKSYTVSSTGGGYNITSLGFTPRSSSSVNTPEPASIFIFATGAFMLLSLKRRIRF